MHVKGRVIFLTKISSITKPVHFEQLGLTKSLYRIPNPVEPRLTIYEKNNGDLSGWEPNKKIEEFSNYFIDSFFKNIFIDIKRNDEYVSMLIEEINRLKNIRGYLWAVKEMIKIREHYPSKNREVNLLIEKVLWDNCAFKHLWQIYKNSDYLQPSLVYAYQKLLKKKLLDADIILKWGGISSLTEFGVKYINELKPFILTSLKNYEKTKKKKFFNVFFSEYYFFIPKNNIHNEDISLIMKIKNDKEDFSNYEQEYYKQFYRNEKDYAHYEFLDRYNIKKGYNPLTHVVRNALYNVCSIILTDAEDLLRVSLGLPKIGEG